MPDVEAVEALYYPGAEVSSVPWLKAALLYWEGILRIVPDGYAPEDSAEVKQLVDLGLLQDLSPAPFRDKASEVFGVRFEELLQTRGDGDFKLEPGGAPRDGERAEALHLTKIGTGLVHDLEKRALLVVDGEWGKMVPEVARLYEITLACVAARELFVAPVTDAMPADVAAAYFAHRSVTLDPGTVPVDGLAWARIVLPYPSPKQVGALSIRQLVAIRERYGRQRRALREKLQARVTGIAALPSVEAVRAHVQGLVEEVRDELELQRAALRTAMVRETWALLAVSAPISIGTGLAVLGAPPIVAGIGGAGSVALGVTDWFLQRDLGHRVGGHYLLTLDSEVGHDHGRLGALMHRLVHGTAP